MVHVAGETGGSRGTNGSFCEEGTWEKQPALKPPQPHFRWRLPGHAPRGLQRPFSQNGEREGRERPSEFSTAPEGSEGQLATRRAGARPGEEAAVAPATAEENEGGRSLGGIAAPRVSPCRKGPGGARARRESAPVERGAGQAHKLQSRCLAFAPPVSGSEVAVRMRTPEAGLGAPRLRRMRSWSLCAGGGGAAGPGRGFPLL